MESSKTFVYVSASELDPANLPRLISSTRRRKVTVHTYRAPARFREKTVACKTFPAGIYIDEHGRMLPDHPASDIFRLSTQVTHSDSDSTESSDFEEEDVEESEYESDEDEDDMDEVLREGKEFMQREEERAKRQKVNDELKITIGAAQKMEGHIMSAIKAEKGVKNKDRLRYHTRMDGHRVCFVFMTVAKLANCRKEALSNVRLLEDTVESLRSTESGWVDWECECCPSGNPGAACREKHDREMEKDLRLSAKDILEDEQQAPWGWDGVRYAVDSPNLVCLNCNASLSVDQCVTHARMTHPELI